MSLSNRVHKLEAEFEAEDLGRPIEERLREATQEAIERRQQGLPRPSRQWDATDSPLAQRLQAAHARAEGLRAWAADGSRNNLETPTNGAR